MPVIDVEILVTPNRGNTILGGEPFIAAIFGSLDVGMSRKDHSTFLM